jgi:uncharacterized protein YkwD
VKILSWLGAFALFLAVAAGTSSVLRLHSEAKPAAATTASSLAKVTRAAEGVMGRTALVPSANPAVKPKPKLVAAPVKAAAPRPLAIIVRSTQQALINQDRARYGLRPLTWSSCLASIAYSNAVRMANQGYISHTNGATRDLGCHLGYHAGENVGWYSAGANDTWANNAFMASPGHRANILSSYYHYVGTSWVRGAKGWYIAVEFS